MSVDGKALGLLPSYTFLMESLILAQDERWRRALYMQVVRERDLRVLSRVANG